MTDLIRDDDLVKRADDYRIRAHGIIANAGGSPEEWTNEENDLYRLVDEMNRKKIILDFAKVQFLASAAIGMLMNLHRKITAIKGTFVICSLRKDLMKVFEIMKLTKVFKFAANEDEALALLGYTAAH